MLPSICDQAQVELEPCPPRMAIAWTNAVMGQILVVAPPGRQADDLVAMVRRSGNEVVHVECSGEGRARCERHRYALIIAVWTRDDDDGILSLVETNAAKIEPAALALIADPRAGVDRGLAQALLRGVDDYLTSGFSSRELAFRIEVALRRVQLRTEA